MRWIHFHPVIQSHWFPSFYLNLFFCSIVSCSVSKSLQAFCCFYLLISCFNTLMVWKNTGCYFDFLVFVETFSCLRMWSNLEKVSWDAEKVYFLCVWMKCSVNMLYPFSYSDSSHIILFLVCITYRLLKSPTVSVWLKIWFIIKRY